MNFKWFRLIVFFLSMFVFSSKASHLVGGDLSYRCLGNGRYEVSLSIYRDCLNGLAPLDNPAAVYVLNKDTRQYRIEYFNLTSSRLLPSEADDPCLVNPPSVCLEKGEYIKTLNLPANTNGYGIVYQRCCRNDGIINLYVDPFAGLGSTYEVSIPGGAICNSTPVFREFPPSFLCVGSKAEFDFSASDADGDVLVYSICAPNTGANQNNPLDPRANLPLSPFPYQDVDYENGFSAAKPLGNNSVININPNTGMLTAIPEVAGQFVVGICVQEFRNGVLLGTITRDFQFNIANCTITSSIPVVREDSVNAVYQINDTTFSSCNGLTVNFQSKSSGQVNDIFWDFGDPLATNDTSKLQNPTYTYSDTGIYKVQLMVNRGQPCGDTSTIEVRVYRELKGDFNINAVLSCTERSIPFTDASTSFYNDIVKWKWYFGDGDSIEVKNPTHTYSSPGTFPVSLIATTQKGCLVKSTQNLTVEATPNADFNLRQVCYDVQALFNNTSTIVRGSIASYLWDFGNGKTDVAVNPTAAYTSNGNYAVSLIATSDKGCKDTVVKNINVIDSLLPDFAIPSEVCVNTAVPFTNISTGGFSSYAWYFGDSAGSTSTLKSPAFTYTQPGNYTIKLVATHPVCGKDSILKTIVVKPLPIVTLPATVALCNGSAATVSLPSSFDSVRWNNGANTFTVQVDGSINPISVTVYKNGCSSSASAPIQVETTPNADFNLRQVCYDIQALFNNTSTISNGSITSYNWDFGNGKTDVAVTPTAVFAGNGNYVVSLIATSDKGCKDTVIKNISIIDSLLPDFAIPTEVCVNSPVNFSNTSTGGFTAFAWAFGDNAGTTSSVKNPVFTYTQPGNYTIKLAATHPVCGKDSIQKTIIVKSLPTVSLPAAVALCDGSTTTVSVPNSYDSVRWNTGATTNSTIINGTINPVQISVYRNGCENVASTSLDIKPLPLADFLNEKYCSNRPTVFNNASTVAAPDNIVSNNWNINNGAFTSGQQSPSFNLNQIRNYNVQLVVTTNSGCKDTLTKVLTLRDTFNAAMLIPAAACITENLVFSDLSKGDNIGYTWTFGDGFSGNDSTISYAYTTAGNFPVKLVVENRNCGTDSVIRNINIKPLPEISLPDSIVTCPDEIKTIKAIGTFDSVRWSNGTNTNPTTIDGNSTLVSIIAYKNGCSATDSIRIIPYCEVFIPTAFSPNNDGLNDTYNIMPLNVMSYTLRIYNRWGELVFETNDETKGWDGKYKGDVCPTDNYIYYLDGIKKDNVTFSMKGILTLLR